LSAINLPKAGKMRGCVRDDFAMNIFFSVGEPSGDLHGSNLIRQLQHDRPEFRATGFGGPRMRDAGCDLLHDMTDLAVMGLLPVLSKLPKFFSLLAMAERYFDECRPDAVVLIDYPGFNWHIARKAKQRGIPVFYYGLPQLWAWASWRVKKVQRYVDHALCKLPFEEPWFRDRGCQATYVGHPYFDQLRSEQLDQPFLEQMLRLPGRTVTILPGSRTQEIKNNLPHLLRAAGHISRSVADLHFVIASYNDRQARLAHQIVAESGVPAEVFVGRTPELIAAASCCLACSGSVSLELLYHAKPSVILYHVPWWTYAVVRRLVQVRYITLVNLLTADGLYFDRTHRNTYEPGEPGHENVLMPEYPTCRDRSADVARHAIEWLTDEASRQRAIARLAQLRQDVGQGGASIRAAQYIIRTLEASRQSAVRRPGTSAAA
jgi:lipid-A-disaccharide synthase